VQINPFVPQLIEGRLAPQALPMPVVYASQAKQPVAQG